MIDKEDIIIRTDNIPLLDELVFQVKKLCLESVVKDEETAEKYETKESVKNAYIYKCCVQGCSRFDMFNYRKYDLKKAGIPDTILDRCYKDKNFIPDKYRKILTDNLTKYWLENYVEKNEYYRMLNGQPEIGQEGIMLTKEDITLEGYNYELPLHEQQSEVINYMYTLGIIKQYISQYPDHKYLNYMGAKSINIVNARSAPRFALLYSPDDIDSNVLGNWKSHYETNRQYTLKRIYSDAFKFGSDYYDNFIAVLIIIQTMLDMFAELPEYIIKMELFDLRTIELMFKSYGIDYFRDIPKRYQLSMLKNVNRLIKYKSTTKNIVDICSLFGFDNIEVFKYYLLKIHKKDSNGHFIISYDEDGNEDVEKMYDLKFLKCPINDIADNQFSDTTKLYDYDVITSEDKYWDGELDHDYVKKQIMKREFNKYNSEYMSIDTMYSMADLTYQLCYFYNLLFDKDKLEEYLKLSVPAIDPYVHFKLVDVLCYMFALGYEYEKVDDSLMLETDKILTIKGFNFQTNMDQLAMYIAEQGFTAEDLGITDFVVHKEQFLTYKQLINLFTKNRKVYDHVIYGMNNADNYRLFKIYQEIYKALFTEELSMEFFTLPDGTQAKTYTEFIKYRDPVLYKSLYTIKHIKNEDTKIETITTIMEECAKVIEYYLDTDEFKWIFTKIPIISAESIKWYLFEVVNFFKSFKIEIMGIDTIYLMDDKLENKVNIIDDIVMTYVLTKSDVVKLEEQLNNSTHLIKEDKVRIVEQIETSITTFIDKFFTEIYDITDMKSIVGKFIKSDYLNIIENRKSKVNTIKNDRYQDIIDTISEINTIISKSDNIEMKDSIIREVYSVIDKLFAESISINENPEFVNRMTMKDYVIINDYIKLISKKE